jgi:hypothetical protein
MGRPRASFATSSREASSNNEFWPVASAPDSIEGPAANRVTEHLRPSEERLMRPLGYTRVARERPTRRSPLEEVRFAPDSPLEETGFEPSGALSDQPSSSQRQDRVEITYSARRGPVVRISLPPPARHFQPFSTHFCDCGDGSGTAPAVRTSCCTRANRSRHGRPYSRDDRRIQFRWQVRRRGTAAFS